MHIPRPADGVPVLPEHTILMIVGATAHVVIQCIEGLPAEDEARNSVITESTIHQVASCKSNQILECVLRGGKDSSIL